MSNKWHPLRAMFTSKREFIDRRALQEIAPPVLERAEDTFVQQGPTVQGFHLTAAEQQFVVRSPLFLRLVSPVAQYVLADAPAKAVTATYEPILPADVQGLA
jgi:hypothetical protein